LIISIPEKKQQILELLEWFGSGAGPWSGYPSYEDEAEKLLLEFYSIQEIVSVIQDHTLTESQTEGAARLFGGWGFSQKYITGLDQVPNDIKQILWDHVVKSNHTDQDKLGRTKRAFQTPKT
jgi:hypothetical protein